MFEALTERDRRVLQAIITDYIQTAEPVGSRIVSKKYKMGLSPATIRNVMADLEEMGFLIQPHTSAGRVPTDKGYRFFVDTILSMQRLNLEEKGNIEKSLLMEGDPDIKEVMKRASQLLSLLSKQTGVVLAPRFGSKIFKHIEFIKLRDRRILVIIVSRTGEVQNKLIQADEEMSQDELDNYSRYLSEIMGGLSLVEEGEGDLFIEGKTNIMQSPEFADMEKMRGLLEAFEEKTKIVKLLDKALSAQGIQIFIGAENELHEMINCSVVAAPYSRENYTLGTLGVIGPTRMDYSNIIPVVDYTARIMGQILGNLD